MNPSPSSQTAPAQGREIILLPRHWSWLDQQPRSASATLRLMVEQARRDVDGRFAAQAAKEQCYLFMRDMAGDRPYFEDACRALFADDDVRFEALIASWPMEIRQQIHTLAARRHGG